MSQWTGDDPHFESDHHALACGMILGVLMQGSSSDYYHDGEATVTVEQPLRDSRGNYTNQILIRVGSRPYTITVDPSLSEAISGKKEVT